MDNGTHTFFSGILRDYKNLDKMMLKTKEWFSKNFKTDTQALIIHNVTKSIRLIYQEMLLVKVLK